MARSSPAGGVKHSSVEAKEELSECEGPGSKDLGEGYHWARAMGAACLVEDEVSTGERRGATVVVLLGEVTPTGVDTH